MSLYFKNRDEAGRQLAEILFHPYGRSQTAILAVGYGGLLVARPIALRLQIPLYMMMMKDIELPGNFHTAIGSVDQAGDFVYRSNLTQGEIDMFAGEYHNHIDQEKVGAIHEINDLLGATGIVQRDDIRERNVIIVSDGLKSGTQLDPLSSFLKPVKLKRIVSAVPVASIDAIDRLHIMTDEIRVLSPKENYLDTEHYYEENDLPSKEEATAIIQQIHQSQAPQT